MPAGSALMPDLARSGSWIGTSGLFVALFLYGWSAIVAAGWLTSLVLPLVWLVLFALAVRWFVGHPYRVLALPFVAVALWLAAMLTR